ncbi:MULTISPECIES: hypothetical protein [Cysteiniphilum]|uniref:Uncharacterized protein n=1 Tax=Cysteiniphilum litorale TaxID=2056700 RepID=A0A8J2Z462_9GAMM|nr:MULTISPECIES: hypothetical protein [Cysteiniphilum]GGF95508.1 hypothetical protein GCM10010995_10940 [Cysteiniphilum litorale]
MASFDTQLLQIQLIPLDKSNKAQQDKLLEINGSFIHQFTLDMQVSGFTGDLTLIPLDYDKSLINSVKDLMMKGAVKINILIQQKLNVDSQNSQVKQLILSGYLTAYQPLTMEYLDFNSQIDAKTKKPVITSMCQRLRLKFTDPLQYWLKQSSKRMGFKDKSYGDVIADIMSPFTALCTLTVDEKLADYQTKRRVIIPCVHGKDISHYEYLAFIVAHYGGVLVFDYQAMQEEKPSVVLSKDFDGSVISWPAIKTPKYQIKALATDGDSKPNANLVFSDWQQLININLENITKSQTADQVINTFPELVKSYPESVEDKPICIVNRRISSAVEDDAKKQANQQLKFETTQKLPLQQLIMQFDVLPSFIGRIFPLDQMDLNLPLADGESLNLFGDKSAQVHSFKLMMSLHQANNEGVCLVKMKAADLKRYYSATHALVSEYVFVDPKEQDLVFTPKVRDMPLITTEGVVVGSSDANQQQSNKSAQYLYVVDKNKSPAIDGVSLDQLTKDELCYWVKLPEFNNLLIQVPVSGYITHAQYHLPLKVGTRIMLKCNPEYVMLDGIIATKIIKPIEASTQLESLFWGADQEMSLQASTDKTGKKQKLNMGIDLGENNEKSNYSIEFDAQANTTKISATSVGESGS